MTMEILSSIKANAADGPVTIGKEYMEAFLKLI